MSKVGVGCPGRATSGFVWIHQPSLTTRPRLVTTSSRAFFPSLIVLAGLWVSSPAVADNGDETFVLEPGQTLNAEAGSKTAAAKAEEYQSVEIDTDPEKIWPSVVENFRTEPGPIAAGEPDVCQPQDTSAPIIFAYGEQECARLALTIIKTTLVLDPAKSAALEALQKSISLAGYFAGFAGAEKALIVAELVVIFAKSENDEELLENLAKFLVSQFGEKFAEKILTNDEVLKYFFGEASEDLVDKIKDWLISLDVTLDSTYSHGFCGEIKIRYRMFSDHEYTPINHGANSLTLEVTGDCEGKDGSKRKLHRFKIVADYALEPFAYNSSGSTVRYRATNPQIFVAAQCGRRIDLPQDPCEISRTAAEVEPQTVLRRPADVGSDLISVGDWSVVDQLCYDRSEQQYSVWHLAKRTIVRKRTDHETLIVQEKSEIENRERLLSVIESVDAEIENLLLRWNEDTKSGTVRSQQTDALRTLIVALQNDKAVKRATLRSIDERISEHRDEIARLKSQLQFHKADLIERSSVLANALQACLKQAALADETSGFATAVLDQIGSQ